MEATISRVVPQRSEERSRYRGAARTSFTYRRDEVPRNVNNAAPQA